MHAPLPLVDTWMDSPLGPLRLVADDEGLAGVYFAAHRGAPTLSATPDPSQPYIAAAHAQLRAYFAGVGACFTFDVRLVARGTSFQQAVWEALRAIPAGETVTYAELAQRLGRPSATRAVGAAVGANPHSIIVPCHRVIGSRGLTGYAGGVPAKAWLLAHEASQRRDAAGTGPLFARPPASDVVTRL